MLSPLRPCKDGQGDLKAEHWDYVVPISPGDLDANWASQFPLQTRGRYIINQRGDRFKLKGVNWYGASDVHHVVGGLDVQSLDVICRSVLDLGFSTVRLPFSNEMLRSQVGKGAISFKYNPQLEGLSALEVYDEVVRCLGKHGVAVIINNHTTYGEFCGPPSKNSLWFDPGSQHTEEQWISDWAMMALRYRDCPHVVGYDLRNEIRPRWGFTPKFGMNGRGGRRSSQCDWARAAHLAADRLASVNSAALIVVERIVWPQRPLAAYAASPGPLLPELGGRLVLAVHHYQWSGPGRFLPNWSVPRRWGWALRLLRFLGAVSKDNYGDMDRERLREQLQSEWGDILDSGTCPVWVSEFGADLSNPEEVGWLRDFTSLLAEKDVDWAYWPLNVGPKPGCGEDEAYGVLDARWRPKANSDLRLDLLREAGLKPAERRGEEAAAGSAPAASSGLLRQRSGSAPDMRRLMAGKDPLRGVSSVPNVLELLPSFPEAHLPHLPHLPREVPRGLRKVFSAGDAAAMASATLLSGRALHKSSSVGGSLSPVAEHAAARACCPPPRPLLHAEDASWSWPAP